MPPVTPSALFETLDTLGVFYETHAHDAVFTVQESAHLYDRIPGGHCKNLFLKNKKDTLFLLVALDETQIDLKAFGKQIGAGRLSFGSPDLLLEVLGVRPGSVTPFALINDTEKRVNVFLDAAMMSLERVNYHPLDNTMTTGLKPSCLLRFIENCGHVPEIVDLSRVPEDA